MIYVCLKKICVFQKAHKSTTHLKTENAFLKSENVKLELRISQLTSDSKYVLSMGFY